MRQYLDISTNTSQMRPVMKPGHHRAVEPSYFTWLLGIVDIPPLKEHENICWELFHTEFFWSLANDENRALDVNELLYEHKMYLAPKTHAIFRHDGAVSVFEMLICLSKRMDFLLTEGGQPTRVHLYFWEMLRNLGYDPERTFEGCVVHNPEALKIWLDRAFSPDGKGSIFPIEKPLQNQREIEIWSQMGDYMHEKYLGRS